MSKDETHSPQPSNGATKASAEVNAFFDRPAKVLTEKERRSQKVRDLHLSDETVSKLEKLEAAINTGNVKTLSELLPANDPENSRLISQLLANTNNAILTWAVKATEPKIISRILESAPELVEIGQYQNLMRIAVSRKSSDGLRIAVSLVRHAAKCGRVYPKETLDDLIRKALDEKLYDCVDQLLGHGADFRIVFGQRPGSNGLENDLFLLPALDYHLETGNSIEITTIASMLVKKHSADADYFDKLVTRAVKAGNASHVAQLLEIRNKVPGFRGSRSSDARNNGLKTAAASGNSTILNMLLNSHPLVRPERNKSLLSRFLNFFDDNFLNSGRFVNKPDGNGNTLLSLAVKSGSKETLLLLLNRGADLTHGNGQNSALALAVIGKRHDVAKLLLTKAKKFGHVWPKMESMVEIASQTDAKMLEILVSSGLVPISTFPAGGMLPEAEDYLALQRGTRDGTSRPHLLNAALNKINANLRVVGPALNGIFGQIRNSQLTMLRAGVQTQLDKPEMRAITGTYAARGFMPKTAEILDKRLADKRKETIDAGLVDEKPMRKLTSGLFNKCGENSELQSPRETIRTALMNEGMYGLLADHIAVSFTQASLVFKKAEADRKEEADRNEKRKQSGAVYKFGLSENSPEKTPATQKEIFTELLTKTLKTDSTFREQMRKVGDECENSWLFNVLLNRQIAMISKGLGTPALVN